MGMSLSTKLTTYGAAENQEWLGSALGTQSADSITLDGASLAALFPTGLVPSGIPLKRNSGTGRYAAAITAEVPDYHLFTSVDLTAGGTVTASGNNSPASGIWIAEVIVSKVAAYTGRTSVLAANTVSGNFKYV